MTLLRGIFILTDKKGTQDGKTVGFLLCVLIDIILLKFII